MSGNRMLNKVAVITGGTSGIGYACACRFAAEGAKLVLADLFADKGAESVASLQAEYGADVIFVQTDVTSEAATEALGAATLAKFGRVDAVIDGGYCGHEPTTVVDMTSGYPEVVREGAGDSSVFE